MLNKPGVEGITVSPRPNSGVRVELSLPGQVQTTVFKLKKFQDKPYRIVIDIVLPDVARQESEAREQVKITRKDRIVVIDPGHGGEAVGAVGKGGTSKRMWCWRSAESCAGCSTGSRLPSLSDPRRRLLCLLQEEAHDRQGIRGGPFRQHPRGRGEKSVGRRQFRLLPFHGGASSEAAQILARNENLADVVGGVPAGEGGEASDPIILDMFQTHAINQSRTFGGSLLSRLEGANHLKFATVQEAPFLVLKLPDIPSVLIETAYISNPKEEKLLRTTVSRRGSRRVSPDRSSNSCRLFPRLPYLRQAKDNWAASEAGPGGRRRRGDEGGCGPGRGEHPRTGGGETFTAESCESPARPGSGLSSITVKKGDTLRKIARRYGTSVASAARTEPPEPPRSPLREPHVEDSRQAHRCGGGKETGN